MLDKEIFVPFKIMAWVSLCLSPLGIPLGLLLGNGMDYTDSRRKQVYEQVLMNHGDTDSSGDISTEEKNSFRKKLYAHLAKKGFVHLDGEEEYRIRQKGADQYLSDIWRLPSDPSLIGAEEFSKLTKDFPDY